MKYRDVKPTRNTYWTRSVNTAERCSVRDVKPNSYVQGTSCMDWMLGNPEKVIEQFHCMVHICSYHGVRIIDVSRDKQAIKGMK